MKLEDYIAVSGLPGLYQLIANRSNGLLLEDMQTGKSKFASVRKHQFTPLGSVAIYTMMDTTPLSDIFNQMKTIPPISVQSPSRDLFEYFEQVCPSFDRDRVYISDIKKVIKWFNFLQEKGLLEESKEEKSKDEEE